MQGREKIAEGREAEIFAWGDGAVLRLLRNANARQQIEWEAAAMRAAATSGARVPEVRELVEVDGRPGVVMERIDGKDYLTIIGDKPWRIVQIAGVLGATHAALHSAKAPDSIPELRTTMRRRIEATDRVPDDLKPVALRALERLPEGDSICHGDFHPGNVIASDGPPAVIDWTNVTRGDAHADLYRTELMIRMGDLPPGTPMFIRIASRFARRLLLVLYGRAYRKHRVVDSELLSMWEAPVVAVRLSEGIEPEREKLLRMLEEHPI